MKNPFRRKRYTVVVIPEVGQSIIRFRLPRFLLILIPLLVVALATSLYVLKDSYDRNLIILESLENKLSVTEDEMEDTIADKNREIEKLQTDIVSLSQQAEEVRNKVEALRSLEAELRGLTGDATGQGDPVKVASATTAAAASTGADKEELSEPHVGGAMIAVDEADVDLLVSATSTELEHLSEEMESLAVSLTDAKEEFMSYQHILRITPSIWPTASRKVTSTFGYRSDPFTGRPSVHSGIDIAGGSGSKVFATADGTVSFAGYDIYSGYNVIINHGAGLKTRYMHLSKYVVKKGQEVSRGEEIGKLGSTGRSTGPHLHYEVIKNGQQVNPKPYMN